MTSHSTSGNHSTSGHPTSLGRLRILGVVWLVAGAVVAVPAFMLALVSDRPGDRAVGLVLMLLVASAAGLGTWLTTSPARFGRRTSLATSAAWLVAAASIYPSQDFVVDAIWAAGVPALAAVVTAVLAAGRGSAR